MKTMFLTVRVPTWLNKLLGPERKSLGALRNVDGAALWAMCIGYHTAVGLDWDDVTRQVVEKDLAWLCNIMPELGKPSLYKTKSGWHALFPKSIEQCTATHLFELMREMSYFRRGSFCSGHIHYSLQYLANNQGITLRVGRKYKGADIFKVEAGDDSAIIRRHDLLIKLFNHWGLPARFVPKNDRYDSSFSNPF